MSRARNVKPGFFSNEELVECHPLARLLFIGLWCEADRRGILEDRPKRLKLSLLPADDCDVDAMLDDLQAHGFIQRYEAGGVRCIKVVNFEKHQNPHQNEKNSELPDAPDAIGADGPMSAREDSDATPVQASERHESDPALTLTLTSSLNPSSLNPEENVNGRASVKKRSARAPDDDEADFEARFYGPYPRHVKREDALKAWRGLTKRDRDAAAAALGVWLERAAFAPDVQFVPYPATWLNGKRWNDDLGALNGAATPPKSERAVAAERIAYLEAGPSQWSVADRDRYKGDAGQDLLQRDLAIYRRVLDGAAA